MLEDLLKNFTEAASKAVSVEKLDQFYKYAARKLATDTEKLDMATDVYSIRRDELAESV